MYKRTITSLVNLSLSSGGLPLFAGYSQSKSRPSKFLSLRNWMVDLTNSALVSWVFTIWVKGLEPMFHPPTAKRVFTAGFLTLMSLNRAYLPKNIRQQWNNCLFGSSCRLYKDNFNNYETCLRIYFAYSKFNKLHKNKFMGISAYAENKCHYHFKTIKSIFFFCYTIQKWYVDVDFLNLYCHSQYSRINWVIFHI